MSDSDELRAAWNELQCCDDIPLDQGLAAGIGYLQADREELRRDHRKAVDDLCRWRSAIQAMTPGGSEFMYPDAVRDWAQMLKRENAEAKLTIARLRKDLANRPDTAKEKT